MRRPASLTLKGFEDAGIAGERGLTLIAMLLWLVPGLLFFSFTTAFGHTYYIATIAPPLAALVGIGAVAMYREDLTEGWKGWILVGAVLITGLLQALFLSYDAAWSGLLIPIVLIGTVGCAGILAYLRIRKNAVSQNHQKYLVIIAIGLLFVAPFVWSCTPLMSGNGNNQGVAGPQAARMGVVMAAEPELCRAWKGAVSCRTRPAGNASPGREMPARHQAGVPWACRARVGQLNTQMVNFLLSHTTNETWILAVPSSQTAGQPDHRDGKTGHVHRRILGQRPDPEHSIPDNPDPGGQSAVLPHRGYGGAGRGMNSGNSEIFSWVSDHCTP